MAKRVHRANIVGYTDESKNTRSSKRLQAISCMMAGIGLFILAGFKESKYAFLGGLVCIIASVVIPLITTYKELKEAMITAKDLISRDKQ